jgi:hypothetical protein
MTSTTFNMYLSADEETDIEIQQYQNDRLASDRVRLTFGQVSGPAHVGISLSQDQLKELRDKITQFRRDNKT